MKTESPPCNGPFQEKSHTNKKIHEREGGKCIDILVVLSDEAWGGSCTQFQLRGQERGFLSILSQWVLAGTAATFLGRRRHGSTRAPRAAAPPGRPAAGRSRPAQESGDRSRDRAPGCSTRRMRAPGAGTWRAAGPGSGAGGGQCSSLPTQGSSPPSSLHRITVKKIGYI